MARNHTPPDDQATEVEWVIEQWNGRRFRKLGVIAARHRPQAMLRAFEKFSLTTNDAQRSIRARRATPSDPAA